MITVYFYCAKVKPKSYDVGLPMLDNYRGFVVAKAKVRVAIRIRADFIAKNKDSEGEVTNCCVSWKELYVYSTGKDIYALELEDISRLARPMETGDFSFDIAGKRRMTKAPQSYCKAYLDGQECYIFSDHQKYCEAIVGGEKTVELRKTLPKKEIEIYR
jgi:predicted transcriptional regulator